MRNIRFLTFAGGGILLFLLACSPELTEEARQSSRFPTSDQATQLKLSFELEAITRQEIVSSGGKADLNFLDEISSEPVASRQAVQLAIYPDGRSEYLIEEQEPQLFSLPSDFEGVPPDDIPPIVKTKISGGMAYFYDAQDVLLYEHPMEEDYFLAEQIARLSGQYDWAIQAKAEGAEVETLDGGTLLIRKAVPAEEMPSGPAMRMAGRYTEEVVVPELNLLLGASLHEADGSLVSRMVYKYNYLEDKDQWIPEKMWYEEHGTNATTGSQYISKTNYYIDNYNLQTK
ncbi:MAG: hypothetical protein ACLFUB_17215 [Cyclobacteriaceae bacterium]